jgi:DNA-directed RNA polymerase specialized sigma24 family protein
VFRLRKQFALPADVPTAMDLLAFDEALNRLAAIDSRKVRAVEFWFFAGMTVDEIADAMDIGTSTVNRDLEFAKVWLARELGATGGHE